MFTEKYSWWKKKLSKETILIAASIALAVVAAIVIIIVFVNYKKNDSAQKDNGKENVVYDLDLTGDAEVDPQNVDLNDEEGATVGTQELVPKEGRSNGIDVSKWQGKIDWKAVKSSGIEFAFVRIGYRGENGIIYKDDNADYNIQQAQKVGVLVGVYFFSTAINETEAKEEANWTLKAIEGYSISYPVVYDCEGYKSADSRMYDLDAKTRTNNALTFLKIVSDAGYDAMFYGARNDLRSQYYWDVSKIEKEYKVWIAYYPAETYPQVEAPEYNNKFHAWQYTNKGNVSGISGNVDMVVCYFKKDLASPKNPNATPSDATSPDLTVKEPTSSSTTPLPKEDIVAGNTFTAKSDKVTAKEFVNLRALPTTDSEIMGTLTSGEFLERTAVSNKGWSRLIYNGKTVYAVTSYLSNEVVTPSAPPTTEQEPETDGFMAVDEMVTAKEETNLRTAPSTEGTEVVHKLLRGEYVRRIGIHTNGWSKLEYNGQIVYAITSYLTTEVNEEETTAEDVISDIALE